MRKLRPRIHKKQIQVIYIIHGRIRSAHNVWFKKTKGLHNMKTFLLKFHLLFAVSPIKLSNWRVRIISCPALCA
jgi:hypothetical protein